MAEDISNVADRGYVYLCLATSLPSKLAAHRKGYLDKALALAKEVPSPLDRLSHLQSYAEEAFAHDAIASAKIHAELLSRGEAIGAYDTFIAAQALRRKMPLITNNVREFSRVKGLVWEDWTN